MTTTRKQIDDFLLLRRLAVVGVSRDPKSFSSSVYQELRQRRYDVVPVNPAATSIDGRPCYAKVQDIQPPVEGVIIMTAPAYTDDVMRDCIEAGVKRVWVHAGMGGVGSMSRTAVALGEQAGIDVVAGFCPFMFLPGTPFFHGLHAFGKKLTGSYPK